MLNIKNFRYTKLLSRPIYYNVCKRINMVNRINRDSKEERKELLDKDLAELRNNINIILNNIINSIVKN